MACSFVRLAPRLAVALLGLALAAPLCAQTDTRATREREALRRAQAALREAQAQQAAAAREKAQLAEQAGRDAVERQRLAGQLATARNEAARAAQACTAEVERLRAERDAALRRIEVEREAAATAAGDAAQRIAGAERTAAERAGTIASLTALLERSTQALAAAEDANRRMYAFGREMIEQYRAWTPADAFLGSDPVIGFAGVRREDRAEELRSRLDATRVPAQRPR